jgi:hypothetical protein
VDVEGVVVERCPKESMWMNVESRLSLSVLSNFESRLENRSGEVVKRSVEMTVSRMISWMTEIDSTTLESCRREQQFERGMVCEF